MPRYTVPLAIATAPLYTATIPLSTATSHRFRSDRFSPTKIGLAFRNRDLINTGQVSCLFFPLVCQFSSFFLSAFTMDNPFVFHSVRLSRTFFYQQKRNYWIVFFVLHLDAKQLIDPFCGDLLPFPINILSNKSPLFSHPVVTKWLVFLESFGSHKKFVGCVHVLWDNIYFCHSSANALFIWYPSICPNHDKTSGNFHLSTRIIQST